VGGASPVAARLRTLRSNAEAAAKRLRVPLRSAVWHGSAGNWAGTGRGSSLDFQDHRPYLPGDDPRHINWHAYARTGTFSMKLYREEVSPVVDLVLDGSASMRLEAAKQERAWELVFFVLESAAAAGAAVRGFVVCGGECSVLGPADIESAAARLAGGRGAGRLSFSSVPFRPGSLRVVVADCLVADPPGEILQPLAAARGRPVVLAPRTREEAQPGWQGQLELVDCETGDVRQRRVDPALLDRYGDAYRRHFEIWRRECRRRGTLFAQVPCEGELLWALRSVALSEGAVELTT
jgi:uncharacterized protein (DUF58 family)